MSVSAFIFFILFVKPIRSLLIQRIRAGSSFRLLAFKTFSSIKTGTRRIIRLDELSLVVRRSRRNSSHARPKNETTFMSQKIAQPPPPPLPQNNNGPPLCESDEGFEEGSTDVFKLSRDMTLTSTTTPLIVH